MGVQGQEAIIKHIHNKSGFTLLEIIIVIIIVGVLASLALPRLVTTIEFARSIEALISIGTTKRAAIRCEVAVRAASGVANDFGACDTFTEIGTENPGDSPGASFSYAITPYNVPTTTWQVVATRVGVGEAVGDTITFSYDVIGGTTTRVGIGAYSGLK